MIKDCYIEIELKSRNYKYYEELGYEIPKYKNDHNQMALIKGSKILVNQKDIPKTSRYEIIVTCDCCGKEFKRQRVNRKTDNDFCKDCIKNNKNKYIESHINNRSKNTYNEIKEYVKEYINNNHTVKGIYKNITHKDQYFRKGYNIRNIVEELGINWFNVCYYGNVERIKTKKQLDNTVLEISNFIKNIPERKYLIDIGITKIIVLKYYDSYNDMFRSIGLLDKYGENFNFVDKHGYVCKSSYEKYLSDYFIDNNIKFTRENQIFLSLGDQGRSDFTLYSNESKIEVEIWGYVYKNGRNNPSGIAKEYMRRYKEKMKLYKETNINLISLYADDFYRSKNQLYEYFDELFLNKNLIKTESYYNPRYNMNLGLKEYIITNLDSIFGELEYIPSVNEFKNFNAIWLIKFIYRNFKDFKECADFIGRKTKRQFLKDNKIDPRYHKLLGQKI